MPLLEVDVDPGCRAAVRADRTRHGWRLFLAEQFAEERASLGFAVVVGWSVEAGWCAGEDTRGGIAERKVCNPAMSPNFPRSLCQAYRLSCLSRSFQHDSMPF